MVESVKITLLLCLTGITSCILFLSYGEYTNRYAIVMSQNNGIYIFDKKTVTLNKCENGKCEVIQTVFPIDKTTPPVQAIPANNATITQNTPATTTSSTPNTISTPVTTSQNVTTVAGSIGQDSTAGLTQAMQPRVNSFLTPNGQLPTLQSSLQQDGVQQTIYGRKA